MIVPNKTPANMLLARIRSRRGTRNYLWLVYSHKAKADLILESHHELAHWLLDIEFNHDILEFWIPSQKEFYEDHLGGARTRPDVIARNLMGRLEWHEVKAGHVDEVEQSKQILTQRQLAANSGAEYKIFDESTRVSRRYEVLPRLRLMQFIAVCRNQSAMERIGAELSRHIEDVGIGTIGTMLQSFPAAEQTHLIGSLVRLAIEGRVSIEIDDRTPSIQTKWSLVQEES